MTTTPPTTTPTTPDRMTAAELRAAFDHLETKSDEQRGQINILQTVISDLIGQVQTLKENLDRIQEGLSHAAQPAAATASGPMESFVMDTILLGYDDAGKPSYKAKGGKFTKFGVRVWPEVLPTLGIDPAHLTPGPNPVTPPMVVFVEVTAEGNPRKVIGRA